VRSTSISAPTSVLWQHGGSDGGRADEDSSQTREFQKLDLVQTAAPQFVEAEIAMKNFEAPR
jgi:hypothetical protein